MPTRRIKMPKKPKGPKGFSQTKKPKVVLKPIKKKPAKPKKPKKPFLRRVKAAVREAVMGPPGKGGGTVGTQQQQIRDLGLMDEDAFDKLD